MIGKNIRMESYLSYIFWCLAAVLNAMMDTIENEHFFISIFRNLNKNFWYKRHSWDKATQINSYKIDAWHLSKSIMVIWLAATVISFKPLEFYIWIVDICFTNTFWQIFFVIALHLFTLGALWNGIFNIMYNKILIYKTWNK